ncbi:SUF system Fe-S cluster assembly protein [bacterium]|nr:SUF system Fe-S cluster assembly protein [bacterium]
MSTEQTTDQAAIKDAVIETLRTIYDPEIPVDIYELGLVYDVNLDPENNVLIDMTLTSPACPVAGSLPPEVEGKVMGVKGVKSAKVNLVWEPPWDKDKMSEAARLKLNLF